MPSKVNPNKHRRPTKIIRRAELPGVCKKDPKAPLTNERVTKTDPTITGGNTQSQRPDFDMCGDATEVYLGPVPEFIMDRGKTSELDKAIEELSAKACFGVDDDKDAKCAEFSSNSGLEIGDGAVAVLPSDHEEFPWINPAYFSSTSEMRKAGIKKEEGEKVESIERTIKLEVDGVDGKRYMVEVRILTKIPDGTPLLYEPTFIICQAQAVGEPSSDKVIVRAACRDDNGWSRPGNLGKDANLAFEAALGENGIEKIRAAALDFTESRLSVGSLGLEANGGAVEAVSAVASKEEKGELALSKKGINSASIEMVQKGRDGFSQVLRAFVQRADRPLLAINGLAKGPAKLVNVVIGIAAAASTAPSDDRVGMSTPRMADKVYRPVEVDFGAYVAGMLFAVVALSICLLATKRFVAKVQRKSDALDAARGKDDVEGGNDYLLTGRAEKELVRR